MASLYLRKKTHPQSAALQCDPLTNRSSHRSSLILFAQIAGRPLLTSGSIVRLDNSNQEKSPGHGLVELEVVVQAADQLVHVPV